MDLSATLNEIATLSVDERLYLVEAIWDSIGIEPDELELTEPQRAELARRLAAHEEAPESLVPWGEVKGRALSRARR